MRYPPLLDPSAVPDSAWVVSGAAASSSLGVDAGDLIVESRPRNTAEEDARIAERVGGRPLVLVTSASHMPRAVRRFEARGLAVIPAHTHYLATGLSGRGLRTLRPGRRPGARRKSRHHPLLPTFFGSTRPDGPMLARAGMFPRPGATGSAARVSATSTNPWTSSHS